MRPGAAALLLGAILISAGAATGAQEPAGTAQPPAATAERAADVKAIQDVDAAFVRAYNAGDAPAIAALFTPDGEVIDERGQVVQGRPAIESLFAANFAAYPGETITLDDVSIKFLGPDVAKEEGRERILPPIGRPASEASRTGAPTTAAPAPHSGRYTVLYVRQNGRWLQSSVREHVDHAMTPHQRLEPLAWLVGEWVDEGSSSVVHSSTRWSDDGNFLLREFTLHVGGATALRGTQRIGWDPLTRQITSWVFDSSGGNGTGLWSHDGNRWIVKARGVLADGRIVTATHVYTIASQHLVRYKSVDRTIGGEVEPDMPELMMVRKPPGPR